jgi:hypothetical protein
VGRPTASTKAELSNRANEGLTGRARRGRKVRFLKQHGASKMWRSMVVAVSMAVLGTGPAPAQSAKDLAITPESPTALLVMQADWWEPAPNMQSAFKIALAKFDPVEERLLGLPYGDSVLFEAKRKQMPDGYLVEAVKPGRWVVLSYSQQDKWALCFNAASVQFDIAPGEIVFLGRFDSLAHRRQLTEQAIRSGRVSVSSSSFADFFDLPEGPRFAPVDEAELTRVREMLAARAAQATAPVRAVAFSPARFGTGSTLFAQRRCGGYFTTGTKKAKDNEPKP